MTKAQTIKIEDTDEAWEADGPLGNDFAHAVVADVDHELAKAIDDSLGLQPISIRLQKSLLENLKSLAQLNGIGYQPLIRQVLTRFVECELKMLLREKIDMDAMEAAKAASMTKKAA